MPLPATEIALLTDTLARQWDRVRTWVGDVVGDDVRGEPSVLPGWTVAELVAHLARAMDALAICVPAGPGTAPTSFAEYLGGYPDRAEDIAETARIIARQIEDAPLEWADARATAAGTAMFRHDAGGSGGIRVRGAIRLAHSRPPARDARPGLPESLPSGAASAAPVRRG